MKAGEVAVPPLVIAEVTEDQDSGDMLSGGDVFMGIVPPSVLLVKRAMGDTIGVLENVLFARDEK